MTSLREQISAFERELDAALATLPTQAFDSDETLALASSFCEVAASQAVSGGVAMLDRGMSILASRLVSGLPGDPVELNALPDALIFASHYYMLREYLYYSYNVPGSMEWDITEHTVDVRFSDLSIPRQFFTVHNDAILGSKDAFSEYRDSAEIERLLKDEPEGVETPNTLAAVALIEKEVDLKLRAYFSILPMESNIDLGGYSYAQFISFYRSLLGKAIYHRYMTRVNGAFGAIFIDDQELISAAADQEGVSPDTTRAILADLVYDKKAVRDRVDASYFSLFREGGSRRRIVMRPQHFALAEGLVNLLRIVANRRPQEFLANVSNDLGAEFVARVKKAWEAEGFTAHSEVSLRNFDATLPDIDLLVISDEPTLGYVMLVCEVKSPIPPVWAKDQLRVLNKDSVSKAFRQVRAVREFLRTGPGLEFLRSLVPKDGLPHFDGFLITVDHLIITSDNAGMFFGAEETKMVNFRTLERLLRRSDGDMAYIQHVLATYNKEADQAVKIATVEFKCGARSVRYQAVSGSTLMDFPQVKWRGSPERQAMIDEFIASGAHPFDILPTDPRKSADS